MQDPRDTYRWKQIRKKLTRQARGTACPDCGQPFNHADHKSRRYPTVDHITPLMHGGDPYDPTNLRVICFSCNARRGINHRHAAAQGRHLPRPRPWHSRNW